jgi:hypothetical protein
MREGSLQAYRLTQERKTGAFSRSADNDVEGWGTMILSIAVGLLALGFFLALGDIFALMGPWMVFAAIPPRPAKVGQEGGRTPENLYHYAGKQATSTRQPTELKL